MTDFVLIGGLWLTPEVWDDTIEALEERGHRAVAVALPGQVAGDVLGAEQADEAARAAGLEPDGALTELGHDPGKDATLADQLAAVLAEVDALDRPVVVGHSAACTLAWLAADRRPEGVSRVVLVGGFPSAQGEKYAAFFPVADGVMAFPGWEPFEGADSADLTGEAKDLIAERAVPVPAGVAEGVVEYGDEARRQVPVTLVCPEFTPDEAKEWIASGDLPELTGLDLTYVDIPTGHWPMVTAPGQLAEALVEQS